MCEHVIDKFACSFCWTEFWRSESLFDVNPFSAETGWRFWRLKSIPALKDL